RDMCVSDLVNAFKVAQPTISHHLGVLRNAGLVEDRKDGQQVYYSLDKEWMRRCCCDFFGMYECCSGFFKSVKKQRKNIRGE
ncbi:MAG: metalloregulator ArsR/SmtB family transcription factor, partial [bacterium]